MITSSEELERIVREGAEAGWPVGVHAIGDAANQAALDAFERSREVWQPLGLRQRIEHAQCLAPEDVGRFAELGVAVSVQFSHAPSDEQLAKRFWPDRLDGTYSFRSLLDSGALLANGSDAPVEELEPWAGVVAAVLDHWREDQRLTLEQALHAICVAPGLAVARRARARDARSRPLRRPRRPRPRPVRVRARGAARGAGRGDDARRPLDAQPAALGLSFAGTLALAAARGR